MQVGGSPKLEGGGGGSSKATVGGGSSSSGSVSILDKRFSAAAQARVDALEQRLSLVEQSRAQGVPAPEMPTEDFTSTQVVRTEKGEDGVLRVYKRIEHRFPTGDVYTGETVNGQREGRGTYYFANGDVYVGEFLGSVFHGVGVLRKADFRECGRPCSGRSYQGEFARGLRHGRGKYASGFGDLYEGEFREDAYHGAGAMAYADGSRYSGQWAQGRREGHGSHTHANGDVYTGHWLRNLYHGEGTLSYTKSKGSYSGTWAYGLRHGIGKRVYGSGAEYEGEWVRDQRSGRGVGKSAMGDLYVGSWLEDHYHGEGSLVKCTGDRYQGGFQRGAFCGVGRYEYEGGGYYEGEYKAMLRMGCAAVPSDRWFWRAWKRTPRTHIYDPISGRLLTVRGRKVEPGQAVEEEVKDPKRIPPSQRLQMAVAEWADRRSKERAERANVERSLADLPGPARKAALDRYLRRVGKQPSDFRPPIIVGSEQDELYLRAGGRGEGVLRLAGDGKRHGSGVRVYPDGSRYEGGWAGDQRQGFGVLVGGGDRGLRYEGGWRADARHGPGVESYGNSAGDWFQCPLGNMHSGGARCFYDGTFEGGYYAGRGTFTCCDGRQYSGEWAHGKRHGFGRLVYLPKDQQYSVARGLDGEIQLQSAAALGGEGSGRGIKLDDAYRLRVYEGHFDKNKRMGLGRETLNRGEVREGTFLYGKLNGVVRITFPPTKAKPKGAVSFAQFEHNERRGWIRGSSLRLLEDGWYDSIRDGSEWGKEEGGRGSARSARRGSLSHSCIHTHTHNFTQLRQRPGAASCCRR